MAEEALADVKVLDLTWHIAGPYCTKLLADYGADVIKVERPGTGDPARSMGPFLGDEPHPERSGLFLHLNTNKRGITLNLKSQTGKKLFRQLVKDVDILVESFRPHVMPSLGLSYEELEKLNPKLVMTSISSFGQTGPYRDFKATDMIIHGMSGPMHLTGIPEREPLKIGGTVISYQVGNIAAVATMFCLYGAEARGSGEHLDVAAFEVQKGSIDRVAADLMGYQYCGDFSVRASPRRRGYPWGTYPCKDGYFDIFDGGVVFFPRAAQMIGMPELAKDPRFASAQAQVDVRRKDEFEAEYFYPWIMERTMGEAWAAAQEARVLSGPVLTTGDLVNDPHYKAREYWRQIDHPVTGMITYPGAPFTMSKTGWKIRRAAPLLGQHNEEVYGGLGYSRGDLVKLRETGVI